MEEEGLPSPWIYAGLKSRSRLFVLNRHTSSTADLNGILECCTIVFDASRDEILGSSRKHEFALSRHAFVKLARDRTQESYAAIAEYLGKRNHATAVNSFHKANALIDTYPVFRDKYEMTARLLKKAETIKEAYNLEQLSDRLDLIKKFKFDEDIIEYKTNEKSIRHKESKTA